jgi:hypothetical protein
MPQTDFRICSSQKRLVQVTILLLAGNRMDRVKLMAAAR